MLRLFLIFTVLCVFTPYTVFAEQAQKKRTVRIGAYENPPKMQITETGKLIGFWPELISYIASEEGWSVEYVECTWQDCLDALQEGEIDIMPDVAFTAKRSETFRFSNTPVLSSWSRVYVRQGDKRIRSLEDLNEMSVGGMLGSISIQGPEGVKRIIRSFNLKSRVYEFDCYKSAFEALQDGFVDAVIATRNYGDEYIQNHPVSKTMIMMSPYVLTFAFNKDSKFGGMLSRKIDMHMTGMMGDNNSPYYQLLTKYFEPAVAEKKVHVLPLWFKVFTLVVLISFVMAALFAYLFRIRLTQKTKELTDLNEKLHEKVAEETLKRVQNEQLVFEQKKFMDMGNMIGAISHQWRQPLNNIYLMSQWLYEQWQEGTPLSKEHEDTFNEQAEIINRMSSIIDDFRMFFQTDEEKRVFSVPETVLSCIRLMTPELLSRKIHIKMNCVCPGKVYEIDSFQDIIDCGEANLYTIGLAGELKQIILSLISNAKDAVCDNGSELKNIDIWISSDNKHISVTIEDNGPGIPEDVLPKIFDPYFTTKQEGSGLGLGLYISKMMLQKHMDGNISLENTGHGIKAVITLKKATV